MKKYFFITIVLILSVFTIQFSFAKSRWVKVGNNWRYELHEGSGDYVMEKWKGIYLDGVEEKVYYFDYYGNMVTGPIVINNQLYVYDDEGAAVSTGFDIDGVHYNTDGRGRVLGLPEFFDLSRFKQAPSAFNNNNVNIYNNTNKTIYDDNNILPTAPTN